MNGLDQFKTADAIERAISARERLVTSLETEIEELRARELELDTVHVKLRREDALVLRAVIQARRDHVERIPVEFERADRFLDAINFALSRSND